MSKPLRPSELPPDWKPGDTPLVIDDSEAYSYPEKPEEDATVPAKPKSA